MLMFNCTDILYEENKCLKGKNRLHFPNIDVVRWISKIG